MMESRWLANSHFTVSSFTSVIGSVIVFNAGRCLVSVISARRSVVNSTTNIIDQHLAQVGGYGNTSVLFFCNG